MKIRHPLALSSRPTAWRQSAIRDSGTKGPRDRGTGGFTLIEVLLAVVISTMLMVSMLGFYLYAAQVRSRAVESIQQINARRLVMERITRELRTATADVQFEGRTDSISFNTAVIPQMSVWNEQKFTETNPTPPQQDVQRVTYELEQYEDESGDIYINGLHVVTEKILTPVALKEGDESAAPVPVALLSPYVRFVRFMYFDGTEWKPDWPGGTIPLAVEIALGTEPLPEGVEPEEYPFDLSRRVVQVHVSLRQGGRR